MAFTNQVCNFINDYLKDGSLNKKALQPAKYYGLTSVFGLRRDAKSKEIEPVPGIIIPHGNITAIVPNGKLALQVYHKLNAKKYDFAKPSFGTDYDIKTLCEMTMVVISNSKLTGVIQESLEPVVLFGFPQRLSSTLIQGLKIKSCLIKPVTSNMNAVQVFQQEYPKAKHFLDESLSMFSVRYNVEMIFSNKCVDNCLCD